MGIVSQTFLFIDTVPSPWNTIIKCLVVIIGLVYVSTKTIKFVPQGSLALKLRFGKVVYKDGKPVIRQPGLQLVWPFTHKLKMVSTLDHPVSLRNVTVALSEYEVYRLRATVVFSIVDVYAVSYVSEDFRMQLASACEFALRDSVREAKSTLACDINAKFANNVDTAATELGVKLKVLQITSVEPYGLAMLAKAVAEAPLHTVAKLGLSVNGNTPL